MLSDAFVLLELPSSLKQAGHSVVNLSDPELAWNIRLQQQKGSILHYCCDELLASVVPQDGGWEEGSGTLMPPAGAVQKNKRSHLLALKLLCPEASRAVAEESGALASTPLTITMHIELQKRGVTLCRDNVALAAMPAAPGLMALHPLSSSAVSGQAAGSEGSLPPLSSLVDAKLFHVLTGQEELAGQFALHAWPAELVAAVEGQSEATALQIGGSKGGVSLSLRLDALLEQQQAQDRQQEGSLAIPQLPNSLRTLTIFAAISRDSGELLHAPCLVGMVQQVQVPTPAPASGLPVQLQAKWQQSWLQQHALQQLDLASLPSDAHLLVYFSSPLAAAAHMQQHMQLSSSLPGEPLVVAFSYFRLFETSSGSASASAAGSLAVPRGVPSVRAEGEASAVLAPYQRRSIRSLLALEDSSRTSSGSNEGGGRRMWDYLQADLRIYAGSPPFLPAVEEDGGAAAMHAPRPMFAASAPAAAVVQDTAEPQYGKGGSSFMPSSSSSSSSTDLSAVPGHLRLLEQHELLCQPELLEEQLQHAEHCLLLERVNPLAAAAAGSNLSPSLLLHKAQQMGAFPWGLRVTLLRTCPATPTSSASASKSPSESLRAAVTPLLALKGAPLTSPLLLQAASTLLQRFHAAVQELAVGQQLTVEAAAEAEEEESGEESLAPVAGGAAAASAAAWKNMLQTGPSPSSAAGAMSSFSAAAASASAAAEALRPVPASSVLRRAADVAYLQQESVAAALSQLFVRLYGVAASSLAAGTVGGEAALFLDSSAVPSPAWMFAEPSKQLLPMIAAHSMSKRSSSSTESKQEEPQQEQAKDLSGGLAAQALSSLALLLSCLAGGGSNPTAESALAALLGRNGAAAPGGSGGAGAAPAAAAFQPGTVPPGPLAAVLSLLRGRAAAAMAQTASGAGGMDLQPLLQLLQVQRSLCQHAVQTGGSLYMTSAADAAAELQRTRGTASSAGAAALSVLSAPFFSQVSKHVLAHVQQGLCLALQTSAALLLTAAAPTSSSASSAAPLVGHLLAVVQAEAAPLLQLAGQLGSLETKEVQALRLLLVFLHALSRLPARQLAGLVQQQGSLGLLLALCSDSAEASSPPSQSLSTGKGASRHAKRAAMEDSLAALLAQEVTVEKQQTEEEAAVEAEQQGAKTPAGKAAPAPAAVLPSSPSLPPPTPKTVSLFLLSPAVKQRSAGGLAGRLPAAGGAGSSSVSTSALKSPGGFAPASSSSLAPSAPRLAHLALQAAQGYLERVRQSLPVFVAAAVEDAAEPLQASESLQQRLLFCSLLTQFHSTIHSTGKAAVGAAMGEEGEQQLLHNLTSLLSAALQMQRTAVLALQETGSSSKKGVGKSRSSGGALCSHISASFLLPVLQAVSAALQRQLQGRQSQHQHLSHELQSNALECVEQLTWSLRQLSLWRERQQQAGSSSSSGASAGKQEEEYSWLRASCFQLLTVTEQLLQVVSLSKHSSHHHHHHQHSDSRNNRRTAPELCLSLALLSLHLSSQQQPSSLLKEVQLLEQRAADLSALAAATGACQATASVPSITAQQIQELLQMDSRLRWAAAAAAGRVAALPQKWASSQLLEAVAAGSVTYELRECFSLDLWAVTAAVSSTTRPAEGGGRLPQLLQSSLEAVLQRLSPSDCLLLLERASSDQSLIQQQQTWTQLLEPLLLQAVEKVAGPEGASEAEGAMLCRTITNLISAPTFMLRLQAAEQQASKAGGSVAAASELLASLHAAIVVCAESTVKESQDHQALLQQWDVEQQAALSKLRKKRKLLEKKRKQQQQQQQGRSKRNEVSEEEAALEEEERALLAEQGPSPPSLRGLPALLLEKLPMHAALATVSELVMDDQGASTLGLNARALLAILQPVLIPQYFPAADASAQQLQAYLKSSAIARASSLCAACKPEAVHSCIALSGAALSPAGPVLALRGLLRFLLSCYDRQVQQERELEAEGAVDAAAEQERRSASSASLSARLLEAAGEVCLLLAECSGYPRELGAGHLQALQQQKKKQEGGRTGTSRRSKLDDCLAHLPEPSLLQAQAGSPGVDWRPISQALTFRAELLLALMQLEMQKVQQQADEAAAASDRAVSSSLQSKQRRLDSLHSSCERASAEAFLSCVYAGRWQQAMEAVEDFQTAEQQLQKGLKTLISAGAAGGAAAAAVEDAAGRPPMDVLGLDPREDLGFFYAQLQEGGASPSATAAAQLPPTIAEQLKAAVQARSRLLLDMAGSLAQELLALSLNGDTVKLPESLLQQAVQASTYHLRLQGSGLSRRGCGSWGWAVQSLVPFLSQLSAPAWLTADQRTSGLEADGAEAEESAGHQQQLLFPSDSYYAVAYAGQGQRELEWHLISTPCFISPAVLAEELQQERLLAGKPAARVFLPDAPLTVITAGKKESGGQKLALAGSGTRAAAARLGLLHQQGPPSAPSAGQALLSEDLYILPVFPAALSEEEQQAEEEAERVLGRQLDLEGLPEPLTGEADSKKQPQRLIGWFARTATVSSPSSSASASAGSPAVQVQEHAVGSVGPCMLKGKFDVKKHDPDAMMDPPDRAQAGGAAAAGAAAGGASGDHLSQSPVIQLEFLLKGRRHVMGKEMPLEEQQPLWLSRCLDSSCFSMQMGPVPQAHAGIVWGNAMLDCLRERSMWLHTVRLEKALPQQKEKKGKSRRARRVHYEDEDEEEWLQEEEEDDEEEEEEDSLQEEEDADEEEEQQWGTSILRSTSGKAKAGIASVDPRLILASPAGSFFADLEGPAIAAAHTAAAGKGGAAAGSALALPSASVLPATAAQRGTAMRSSILAVRAARVLSSRMEQSPFTAAAIAAISSGGAAAGGAAAAAPLSLPSAATAAGLAAVLSASGGGMAAQVAAHKNKLTNLGQLNGALTAPSTHLLSALALSREAASTVDLALAGDAGRGAAASSSASAGAAGVGALGRKGAATAAASAALLSKALRRALMHVEGAGAGGIDLELDKLPASYRPALDIASIAKHPLVAGHDPQLSLVPPEAAEALVGLAGGAEEGRGAVTLSGLVPLHLSDAVPSSSACRILASGLSLALLPAWSFPCGTAGLKSLLQDYAELKVIWREKKVTEMRREWIREEARLAESGVDTSSMNMPDFASMLSGLPEEVALVAEEQHIFLLHGFLEASRQLRGLLQTLAAPASSSSAASSSGKAQRGGSRSSAEAAQVQQQQQQQQERELREDYSLCKLALVQVEDGLNALFTGRAVL